jgi:hypothetical protein
MAGFKQYLALAWFGATVTSVHPALAEDVDPGTRSAARALATDGVLAFQKGDNDVASNKLERAYSLLRAPSIGLWSARALAKSGKLVEAAERYLETTRLSGFKGEVQVQKAAQADAEKELAQLSPRIPSLIVQVPGADTSTLVVTLDGVGLQAALLGEKRPVNPGEHRVEAKLGDRHAERSLTLAEGQQSTVTLNLGATRGTKSSSTKSPPLSAGAEPSTAAPIQTPPDGGPESSTRRTLGYVALSVGGAGLLVGGISGVLALGKRSEVDKSALCPDSHCPRSMQGTVNSLNSFRTVSTIGFIAGGAFAAAGLALELTAGASEGAAIEAHSARLTLHLTPSSIAVLGNF